MPSLGCFGRLYCMGKKVKRQQPKSSPYLVFVSHATADKWLATILCEKIEQTGAQTFRDDRDIHGGDDIPEEIRRQRRRRNRKANNTVGASRKDREMATYRTNEAAKAPQPVQVKAISRQ